jgi:hypothetical protein
VNPAPTALLVALASLSFVGSLRAEDPPAFKTRLDAEKAFITKVGEAVVKAVRTSPAKLSLSDYKITDPKPNRKLLAITMNWAGSITGKKFTSEIRLLVDSADRDNWEVIEIEYSDNNPSPKIGMERNLKALKDKFNR